MSERVKQALRVRAQGAKSRFVFPAKLKKDAPLSYVAIAKRFTRLREAAGIPDDLVLYSGRHTFATDLLDRTGNIKLVSEVLGTPRSLQRSATCIRQSEDSLSTSTRAIQLGHGKEELRHVIVHVIVPQLCSEWSHSNRLILFWLPPRQPYVLTPNGLHAVRAYIPRSVPQYFAG
jgi:Phage integrase family